MLRAQLFVRSGGWAMMAGAGLLGACSPAARTVAPTPLRRADPVPVPALTWEQLPVRSGPALPATFGQFTPPAPQARQTAATGADLERLVAMMTGSFDSADQAAADPAFFDIRLHMSRIWTDRPGPAWLYVEQAMAERQDKPYRQRVYRVSANADGTFTSEVFELPGDPLALAGAWNKPELLAGLTPERLVSREGCAITLRPLPTGAFAGSTGERTCPSTLRGATYATSEVTLDDRRLISWDRGFDAQGKQVWGAVTGGYIFTKRN